MLTDARVPDLPEWLHDLYPFRTRTLQVGDYRLSFVDEGPAHARAVVMLHGNPTWSFLYRHAIRRLSSEYRIIAPDTLGFGLSDKPADPGYHTLKRHIANFTQLVEALDLRNFTLVAHGWGGPIGLAYASAVPGNVARLVLINTWACNLPNLDRIKLPWRLRFAAQGRLGAFFDNLLNLSMHATFDSRTFRPLSDWALEAYTYPFPTPEARTGIGAFTRMFMAPDAATHAQLAAIQAGLKGIDARAEILWGARDPVLTPLAAYLLRDDLRHAAEPIFFQDASHYLPEDLPDALPDTLLRPTAGSQPSRQEAIFKIL